MFYVVGKCYFANRSINLINYINTSGADQTIRVRENNFDIYDAFIQFFPKFPMEIFNRFEVFRLSCRAACRDTQTSIG